MCMQRVRALSVVMLALVGLLGLSGCQNDPSKVASINGTTLSGVAIYVLRNTTFFALTGISTLGAKAPTAAQMEDQAKVTLGRVP